MNIIKQTVVTLFIASAFPMFSQTISKGVPKTETKIETAEKPFSFTPKSIYIIDGVRTESTDDYTKLKTSELSTMSIITDPTQLKQFTKQGEKIMCVYLITTNKVKAKPVVNNSVTAKGVKQ